MARKRNRRNAYLTLGFLFAALLAIGLYAQAPFALFGETVYVPRYYTAECVERTESMELRTLGVVPTAGALYACSMSESKTWMPTVPGVSCEFTPRKSGATTLTGWICPEGVSETQARGSPNEFCDQIIGLTDRTGIPIKVAIGESLYLNPTSVFFGSSVTLDARYPAFGLRIRNADGFVSPTTTTCLVNDLRDLRSSDPNANTQIYSLDPERRIEVLPGAPVNAVTGLQPAISTQVATISGVNRGEPIYITRPGFYYPIKSIDSFRYADTSVEFTSSLIECIPRTIGCSDTAKIVPLAQQSCDIYGGALTSYSPVEGDSSKLCKYACVDGSLQLTEDCITVQDECPDDRPLWDTTTGECVAVLVDPEVVDDDDVTFFLTVGLAVTSIILGMMLVQSFFERRMMK
jgi:hypothetical protein